MTVGVRSPSEPSHEVARASPSFVARVMSDLAAIRGEQRDYSELLRVLARRDLKVRYQNTILGVGWAVFTPLLQMVVFTLIFTRVVPLETGVPYPMYVYTGLVAWSWFASALRFAGPSLISNPHLITKVYFPREVLPLSAVIVASVDFAVASAVLAGMMAYFEVTVGIAILALPVIVLAQLLFTAAMALGLALAFLRFADVKYVFELLLTLWMFASAVLYPVDRIGGAAGALLQLNPMTIVIDAYRAVLLFNAWPNVGALAIMLVSSAAFLVVMWVIFHRAEGRFAEEI